jgi:NitT/TauT family transport system ATP-binding protein
VLTGERLRSDILALWRSGSLPTKAILVVSHNIEEAVLMADRVLIFASDPGRIRCQLAVDLPRPRVADSTDVRALVDEAYALMTAGAVPAGVAPHEPAPVPSARLPEADVARMDGLLDLLKDEPFKGRADLPQLVAETGLADAELLPVAHALALLGLAELDQGDLKLTAIGRRYAQGNHVLRQEIFGQQLLEQVPLAARIRHSLEQEPSGQLPDKPFLRMLSEELDEAQAARVLHTAIAWGRHGEVYEYDYTTGMIRLPTGEEEGDEAEA